MAAKVVPGLDDNTRLSILDELRPEHQQEGDVTVHEAAKDWKVSTAKAREILETAVVDGTLERINGVRFNERKGLFYRRVVKLDETI